MLIVGTSGHIDHGKTTLVLKLTGIETDRLKEEKQRGISIELGFAFIDLPGGRRLGRGSRGLHVLGHANMSCALIRASASRSTSEVVLYIAKDARQVAVTP